MSEVREMTRPRYPRLWWAIAALALAMIVFGVWCFVHQTRHGFIATTHANPGYGGAAWGSYIVFYIFFVGVGFAGVTILTLWRIFGVKALGPTTRLADLLTIMALIAGAFSILADLGRPLHGLMNLPLFARPQSPIYGTFTMVVAGYLFSSLIYFYLSTRRDAAKMAAKAWRPIRWIYRAWAYGYKDTDAERHRHRVAAYWLTITILPLLIIVLSTEGFIFGIQPGRPGWFSALQAPSFVILAGVSGTGVTILILLGARKMFELGERISDGAIAWLGNFMATLALVYLYFMVAEELTASYAGQPGDRHVAHVVVAGRYAPLFWITIACLVLTFAVPFVLRLRRRISVPAVALVAVLANVAAVFKRWLIVVPSQTDGAMIPLAEGGYSVDLIETGVVLGLVGLIVLVILVFGRFFPLVPSEFGASSGPGTETPGKFRLRVVATTATVLIGVAAIGVGLADSFRLFSGGELDPMIPYSPVIFAGGVILFFSSAIVYEVFPPAPSVAPSIEAGDESE